MAWTQADVDALKAAIGSGARSVTYSDGSRIEYRDLEDMNRTLRAMRADLGQSAPIRAFRGAPRSGY